MKCYISSSCSSKKHIPEIVRELTGFGFHAIELTGNISYSEDVEGLILKYRDIYDLDVIIHNYLPLCKDDIVLNLSSSVSDTLNKTLNIVHRAIELSRKLGKNHYTIHPGFRHELLPKMIDGFFIKVVEMKDCNSRDDFYKTVRDISRYYVSDEFKVAIENLSPKSPTEVYSFMCTQDDMIDFLEHFENMPRIGMLLDLGHLNVAAHMLGFDKYKALDKLFDKYGDRIFEIHMSDNDGTKDFHRISAIDSWQVEYIAQKRNILKEVPVVFEWQGCASKETFKRYEIIRSMLECL